MPRGRLLMLAAGLLIVMARGDTRRTQQPGSTDRPAVEATPAAQRARPARECSASSAAAEGPGVLVYFHCGNTLPALPQPLTRGSSGSDSPLSTALQALLAGPTDAEQAAGFHSPFSSATAGLLIAATVDAQGHAVVNLRNFHPLVSNITTAAGMQVWQSQLDATVFQFTELRSVDYQIEGDCRAYWLPFQTTACQSTTRADWERRKALWGDTGIYFALWRSHDRANQTQLADL